MSIKWNKYDVAKALSCVKVKLSRMSFLMYLENSYRKGHFFIARSGHYLANTYHIIQ